MLDSDNVIKVLEVDGQRSTTLDEIAPSDPFHDSAQQQELGIDLVVGVLRRHRGVPG